MAATRASSRINPISASGAVDAISVLTGVQDAIGRPHERATTSLRREGTEPVRGTQQSEAVVSTTQVLLRALRRAKGRWVP